MTSDPPANLTINGSGPFLTLVTRCCHRPRMLSIALDSVLAQTDRDLEVIFIIDNKRRGVPWANKQFAKNTHRVDGKYVYTLDDDSKIINPTFVATLKSFTEAENYPGVVMVKSKRPQLAPKRLPKKGVWGNRDALRIGATNGGCFVTRSDWWMIYARKYGSKAAGDWLYLKSLRDNPKVTFGWMNLTVKETQQLGRGRKFENVTKNWLSPIFKKYNVEEVEEGDFRLQLWKN